MKHYKLFSAYKLGKTELQNRIVMSPMTRSRATGNIPNDLNCRVLWSEVRGRTYPY